MRSELLRCPGCDRLVRPGITERELMDRGAVALTLPEFPLDSGVISTWSVVRVTVECPMGDCGQVWEVWPDEVLD